MRQVVPFSLGQNGHWILFLLRKTCIECLRPTGSFLRSFFFSLSYPLSSVFVLFFWQLCLPFFHLSLITIPPSVTPRVSFQLFWIPLCTTILRSYIVWNVALQLSPHLIQLLGSTNFNFVFHSSCLLFDKSPSCSAPHCERLIASGETLFSNVASSADASNKERDQCPTPPHPTPRKTMKVTGSFTAPSAKTSSGI